MDEDEDQTLVFSSRGTFPAASRSSSPASVTTTNASISLHRASNTVDDLTRALESFTRGTTIDPPQTFVCCCGRQDCETTEAWLTARAKLEKSLQLSAEVGQALLERHEAYVRRQDAFVSENTRNLERADARIQSLQQSNDQFVTKMADLIRENSLFEKRLAQSHLHVDVAESSNRTLLKELQETRSAVNRLSTQNAKSAGWEIRVASLTRERDDLRQEKESERQKARIAELKATAAREKCAELKDEINQLTAELDSSKMSRSDLSEMLLQDAKARLQMLQNTLGYSSINDEPEVTRVLESLVADNEALKRDNAELQNLLTESREDLRVMREELEEQKVASSFPANGETIKVTSATQTTVHSRKPSYTPSLSTLHRGHRQGDSWAASFASTGPQSPSFFPRQTSSPQPTRPSQILTGRKRRSVGAPASTSDVTSPRKSLQDERSPGEELSLTSPVSEYRPLSPADSTTANNYQPISHLSPPHAINRSGHRSSDAGNTSVEEDLEEQPWTPTVPTLTNSTVAGSPEKVKRRKPLVLLSRSQAVQTDGTGADYPPDASNKTRAHLLTSSQTPRSPQSSAVSIFTPQDGVSETSSIHMQPHDTQSPVLPQLIERVGALQTRITQSDIRTLTNRLKRQNLAGMHGDSGSGPSSDMLGHLSRSTIATIVSEVNNLRSHFKSALEMETKLPGSSNTSGLLEASLVTRKDLRALLKLMKDLLAELTQMRALVNAVTLDPSSAAKLKDEAINGVISPGEGAGGVGADSDTEGPRGRLSRSTTSAMGWIGSTPLLGKFFSATPPTAPTIDVSDADDLPSSTARRPTIKRGRPSLRTAPKLAPAVSASTTTVEVEFASTGPRRAVAVTSTTSTPAAEVNQGDITVSSSSDLTGDGSTGAGMPSYPSSQFTSESLGRASSRKRGQISDSATKNPSLMGIFAGAPQPSTPPTDKWVLMPGRTKVEKQLLRSSTSNSSLSAEFGASGSRLLNQRRLATIGFNPHRLSRIVDAVTDLGTLEGGEDEEGAHGPNGISATVRERTLRPRGLSDSSIHSTFLKATVSPANRLLTPASVALSAPAKDILLPTTTTSGEVGPQTFGNKEGSMTNRESVLRALSRKVQSFKYGMPGTSPGFFSVPATNSGMAAAASALGRTSATTSGRASLSGDAGDVSDADNETEGITPPAQNASSTVISPPRPIPKPSRHRSDERSRSRPRQSLTESPGRKGFLANYAMSAGHGHGSLREDGLWNRGGREFL